MTPSTHQASGMLHWLSDDESNARRVVFMDRDGVINRHIGGGYVCRIDDLVIPPDVLSHLRRLSQSGYDLVIVTNQSCVERGLVDIDTAIAIMNETVDRMTAAGIACRAWFCCPHRPDSDCDCRKPKPGMLIAASRALNVELESCSFIGDSESDMEAARRAGARGILVERNAPHSLALAIDALVKGDASC